MAVATFDWLDYAAFGLMMCITILIGIYFGCFGSKQKSVSEYLFGGNNMKTLPVALSLIASFVSSFTLISIPTEIYTDGACYVLLVIGLFFCCAFSFFFVIPVFYELKVTTAYEYLGLRFNRTVRTIASAYYSVSLFFYLPSVIYISSLTLSQVTGLSLHIITTGMTVTCVFYTMIGGLKAVVWTDFIQISISFLACFAIVIIGTIDAGGISKVLTTSYDDGVLNVFKMNPNPFIRTTFWTMVLGSSTSTSSLIGVGQSYIQRYLSLPSLKEVKKAMIIFWIGYSLVMIFCVYCGVIIYVAYYGCDPVEQQKITKADQVFPYYIMDKIGYVPVLPGLYIAGVFGASLSTLSTGLNTLAGLIFEDFLKTKLGNSKNAHLYMKISVGIIGILCIALVFILENLGKILPMTIMLTSITNAPLLTLFILGLMVPIANTKGAIASIIGSTASIGWIVIGSTLSEVNLELPTIYPEGNVNCPNSNDTSNYTSILSSTQSTPSEEDDIFIMYKLSFMHYVNFGLIFGLSFGIITSYLTGKTDLNTLDPALIAPPIRKYLPLYKKSMENRCEEKLILEKI